MADSSVATPGCTCPRCREVGISVAAMNYRETQVWDKDGQWSGTGVGLGTFGAGIGMAGGSYSEHGHQASKRAETFDEPRPYALGAGAVLFMGILMAGAFNFLPSVMNVLADGRAVKEGSLGAVNQEMMASVFPYLIPVVALALLGVAVMNYFRTQAREDKLNAIEYPKRLARYNELRYCASCHTLFDAKGNACDANPYGFAEMMSIPSQPHLTAALDAQ